MKSVVDIIRNFNAGRDPERLALKLRKMRSDPFVFLRGACHLFYDRLPLTDGVGHVPVTWLCGDLHLENFGSYKADNRLVYFDLNDFDEAALGPCTLDLVRFLASLLTAAGSLAMTRSEASALCNVFLESYGKALATGEAYWVETETAEGLVQELLTGLKKRKRPDFLDTRTEMKGRLRCIRVDGRKALAASERSRTAVEKFMADFARTQPEPGFFQVLDVAQRIAGTGSLGVDRFIVLVAGKGSPDGNHLLDLKASSASTLAGRTGVAQPHWSNEATRVVAVQQLMQAQTMAFLHAVSFDGKPYVLRALQPSEDRIDLAGRSGVPGRLESVVATMGEIVAWAQLRSRGCHGSAPADELIDFGRRWDWRKPLLDVAANCAATVAEDWQTYCVAFDAGEFT